MLARPQRVFSRQTPVSAWQQRVFSRQTPVSAWQQRVLLAWNPERRPQRHVSGAPAVRVALAGLVSGLGHRVHGRRMRPIFPPCYAHMSDTFWRVSCHEPKLDRNEGALDHEKDAGGIGAHAVAKAAQEFEPAHFHAVEALANLRGSSPRAGLASASPALDRPSSEDTFGCMRWMRW